MTQKDYILRIAENVGRALAQIIYDKEIHDYQGALSLIDELCKQTVGAGSGFIHAISEETLLAMLTLLGILNVDRKSTRLNSSHQIISYAVFCLKKKHKHRYIIC